MDKKEQIQEFINQKKDLLRCQRYVQTLLKEKELYNREKWKEKLDEIRKQVKNITKVIEINKKRGD